jgi:superfamily II DNA or RNA helicase
VTAPGDLEVDIAMGTWRRGKVPRMDLPKLLSALAKVSGRVTYEGDDVTVSMRHVVPVLTIDDANRGFYCQLSPDSSVDYRFRNGAALVGNVIRPVDDAAGIPEGDRRLLERGRGYSADEVVELMHLLTRIEKLVPIIKRTKRLPDGNLEPARLVIDTRAEDDRLVVLPTIVYGDPPIARVDRGALTILDPTRPVPIRDERDENRLAQRLFQTLGLDIGRRTTYEGADAVHFATKLEAWRTGAGKNTVGISGDGHGEFSIASTPLRGFIAMGEDGVSIRFESEDGDLADPVRVMRAWSRGSTVAALEGGGYAGLPTKWLAEYGPTLMGLVNAKADKDEVPLSAAGDVLALADKLGVKPPPRFDKLRALIGDFTKLPAADFPTDLTAELRPYQKDGVAWLDFHRNVGLGALLADDMGLGKTLQALTSLRGRSLVVAPTSVVHNWVREAKKFRPALKVSLYYSPNRKLDPTADLTLTSWSILRLDIDLIEKEPWDTIILDEAQTIKNPDSQVARAAHRLNAAFRIALTGTPVENRLSDLWSQMQFVEPGLLGLRQDFDVRYSQPIAGGDALRAAELRQRIRPFLLRRKKADVAPDLPPRTEIVERCELSTEERSVYDALRAAAQKEVMEALSGGANVIQALELLLRLRQAACHRGLIPGQKGQAETSSKIELLMELLDPLISEGHKVLVFSQWTSFLDLIEPALNAATYRFLRLDGQTNDRQAVVDGFQDPNGPPVLLLSLKAGGTGLTLTAADHVVLMDPWWNPAVEDQAADRAHRIGQDKPVFIYRLVAADTVEEKIVALQEEKRRLSDAALSHGAGQAGLTRDDLMALLS